MAQNKVKSDFVFIGNQNFERPAKWTEGTNQELLAKLWKNITYPSEDCLSGMTVLQITIDTMGVIVNSQIKRSISPKIDRQLLDEIKKYSFEPGYFRSKKTESTLYLPFKLD